ncbi:MAG: glycosyltransferase family 39 protein [Candidatus Zixiibacteriota bacterium]
MFERLKFRNIIMALAILCGLIRILFVTTQEQLPVMWDARLYSSAALGTIHFLFHPDKFGHPEFTKPIDSTINKAEFISVMNDFIDGEQIEWLYYPIPDMPTAQEYIFIAGPVYPLYLGTVFLSNPVSDFLVIRILNAIIEAFCLVLLMLIAKILFNNRVAIISGLVYCFYLPFIVLSGMVSPDSLVILLTLLAIYLLVIHSRGGRESNLYLAGAVIGLLVLTRSTATLLIVPFALGYSYDNRHNVGAGLLNLVRMIVPFAIIVIPWLIIASSYYGQITLRDPSYAQANLRTSSMIESEGYDLDYFGDDYWTKPVWENILENKTGYIKLLAKKFIRLWAQPFNDFAQYFIMNEFLSKLFHMIIVLTGLFGIFIFFVKKETGHIYLFLIPTYYTLLHIIFHSLARYNLNAMPMMIVASSAVLYYTFKYIKELYLKNAGNILLIPPVIVGALIILFPPVTGLISILGITAGLIASMLLRLILLVGIIAVLFLIVRNIVGLKSSRNLIAVPSIILIVLLLLIGNARESWAEWSTVINHEKYGSLGVKIYIPTYFRLQENDRVRIAIDMTSSKKCQTPFIVRIDEAEAPFILNEPPLSNSYYQKMSYPVFQKYHDKNMEEMRCWRRISLSPQLFNEQAEKYGFVEISIICDKTQESNDSYLIYGNYISNNEKTAAIPSFMDYSIERFVEKGDPRVGSEYPLSSDSVISYNINYGKSFYNDLSELPGRQFGRYRIYLEVMKTNGDKYYF